MSRTRLSSVVLLLCLTTALSAQGSLTTQYTGTSQYAGYLFNVHANTDITLCGLSIHRDAGIIPQIRVYSLPPGGNYLTAPASSWTLEHTWTNVVSPGAGMPTELPHDLNISIAAGQTRALYVTQWVNTFPKMYSTNTSSPLGSVAASNADLEIRVGTTAGIPFLAQGAPHEWDGTLHYNAGLNSCRPYPGSGADLVLKSGFAGAEPNRYGVKDFPLGSPAVWRIESPGGTYVGSEVFLYASVFPAGSPPGGVPGIPYMHVNVLSPGGFLQLTGPPAISNVLGGIYVPLFGTAPITIGANGTDLTLPGSLTAGVRNVLGTSFMTQVHVFDPLAPFGFVTTDAIEQRFVDDRIHVSLNGNDTTGAGTKVSPYRTINHAYGVSVATAVNGVYRPLQVLGGVYNERLDWQHPVTIRGGLVTSQCCADEYFEQNNAAPTTVVSNSHIGHEFRNFGGETLISGLKLVSGTSMNTNHEMNAGALLTNISSDVTFRNCTFESQTPSTSGINGAPGTPGASGADGGHANAAINWVAGSAGGNGGAGGYGSHLSGGNCVVQWGFNGFNGTGGSLGGSGGMPGTQNCGPNDGSGGNGLQGLTPTSDGAGGSNGAPTQFAGSFTGGFFNRLGGLLDGTVGGIGAGGGGGGGGGMGYDDGGLFGSAIFYRGGGGGGGGGGGSGGGGGASAFNGGGSFSVFCNNASPRLASCVFNPAPGEAGGTGGDGGVGGSGGLGGSGNTGDNGNYSGGTGGPGGNGADGGQGGGGAGGHGGPSACIARKSSSPIITGPTYNPAPGSAGGAGGTGASGTAPSGTNGLSVAIVIY